MTATPTLKRRSLRHDLITGEIAALDNLISHCDDDIDFQRDDLTETQNLAMRDALGKLRVEFQDRINKLQLRLAS